MQNLIVDCTSDVKALSSDYRCFVEFSLTEQATSINGVSGRTDRRVIGDVKEIYNQRFCIL